MKIIFYFISLLLLNSILTAEPQYNDSVINDGIHKIYNLQFEAADSIFSGMIKEMPKNPVGYFFNAMIDWWKIALNLNNEEYDDIFYEKLETTIDICDDALDENPEDTEAMFFKGGALGFRGRLKSIREDWFDAALDGKEALPLVYKVAELDPLNIDVRLGFGIYNYYAAAVPEKYPFVKPFMVFFPGGDKKKGLEQLKYVAENGKYAKYESLYFLLTINYGFEENNLETLKYATLLFGEFPENAVFERYIGRVRFRLGNYAQSTVVFNEIYSKCKKNKTGYTANALREASYYIGLENMKKDKYQEAIKYFEECRKISFNIDTDEASGFLINSSLYLGRLYKNIKQFDKAVKYLEEVLEFRDYRNSHSSAENDLIMIKKTLKN